MKRKGIQSTRFILALVLALALLLILGGTFNDFIVQAGKSAQGCTRMASVLSDMTGGSIQLC